MNDIQMYEYHAMLSRCRSFCDYKHAKTVWGPPDHQISRQQLSAVAAL